MEPWKLEPHEFAGYTFKVGTKYLTLMKASHIEKTASVICRLPLDYEIRCQLEFIGDDYPRPNDERRFIEIAKLIKSHMHDICRRKEMYRPSPWDFIEKRFLKRKNSKICWPAQWLRRPFCLTSSHE